MCEFHHKVAAIILNYNSWEASIEEARVCREVLGMDGNDILIIDNKSPNNSLEMLKKYSNNNYMVLQSDTNSGYAAGNNIGLKYAFSHRYKYGLILNNDIIIEDSDMIKKLICVFENDSRIAAVNPDIYSADGYCFNRDAVRPSFWDFTFGMISYRKRGRNIVVHNNYAYVYRPQGCCMMLDLQKMNQINYFDENTFLYFEEPILAEKLMVYKYKCAVSVNCSVIHNHSSTVKNSIQKKSIIDIQNNSMRYYLNNYRRFNKVQIDFCLFFNTIKNLLI